MKRLAWMLMAGLVAGSAGIAQEPIKDARPVIDIAILLDTSGSMNGLIDQARSRLWDIVNSMATTKKDGKLPELRVALYEYGKKTVPAQDGFVRRIVPLTVDLDKISEELFSLKTNGGSEFCGTAIAKAVKELTWAGGEHYQAIFIAGNEPFTQGSVDYRDACKSAIAKGIMVNTIHCGPEANGVAGKWKHAATLADGKSINIDQNHRTAGIVAPQDKRLAELNQKLNGTYLAYGKPGRRRLELQKDLDEKARKSSSEGLAQRAVAKSSAFYRNSTWDLIDALAEKKVELKSVEKEDLPREMRDMSLEEKEAYIAKKATERKAVKTEMKKLSEDRKKYVAAERKKMAEAGAKTFDSALRETLKQQLQKKGFKQ